MPHWVLIGWTNRHAREKGLLKIHHAVGSGSKLSMQAAALLHAGMPVLQPKLGEAPNAWLTTRLEASLAVRRPGQLGTRGATITASPGRIFTAYVSSRFQRKIGMVRINHPGWTCNNATCMLSPWA